MTDPQTALTDETGRVIFRGTQSPGGGSQPVQSGEGPPGAGDTNVVPVAIGALYVDTSAGGLYIALGATSADWYSVAGQTLLGFDFYPGFVSQSPGNLSLLASAGNDVTLADAFVGSGVGNRLFFASGPADGQQVLLLQLGAAGQWNHAWLADGTYIAANGVIFPTADPLVAGAWWDNNGVLAKSEGP